MKKGVKNTNSVTLTGQFAGVEYPVAPGETINLESHIAAHIVAKFRKLGMIKTEPVYMSTHHRFVANAQFDNGAYDIQPEPPVVTPKPTRKKKTVLDKLKNLLPKVKK